MNESIPQPAPLIPEGFQGRKPEPRTAPAAEVLPPALTDSPSEKLPQVYDTPRPSILQEADAIAGQDRSRDYGHPYDNHRRIAEIWSVQAEHLLKDGAKFTPDLVALMMIGLKLARLANSPSHRDSMVDVCGYAKCWEMILEHGGE